MQVEGANLLRNPRPIRALMERRNMSKYCKFHKERGYGTIECFQLCDQIKALIRSRYLQEYISGLVTTGRQTATAPHTSTSVNNVSTRKPNGGPLYEVCTISRGYATGDSNKARKDNVRLARDIAMGHQIKMAENVAKLSRRKNIVISFTDKEARCLIHPHTDGLMETLSVDNGKVFRILIDTGSSANILFAYAFRHMKVGGSMTRPIKTPLYGFGRERVYAEMPSNYQ